MLRKKQEDTWKLINMRVVNNLLGVELLHNLYNQHISKLNGIRFRNTIIVWKNNIAKSYAPEAEWDMLSSWVSSRFTINDSIFLKEIKSLLTRDKTHLSKLVKIISSRNLKKQSREELGFILIDLQHALFGELYPVNLVQLEYSLTQAIYKHIESRKGIKIENLSQLLKTSKITQSGYEENAFNKIVNLGKKLYCYEPHLNPRILFMIKNHYKKFAYMHCAYGEDPYDLDFYFDKYKTLFSMNSIEIRNMDSEVKQKKINILDKKLKLLIDLMKQIGTFRDQNKSMLGQTMRYKYDVLKEISRRKIETRENLNYYLLSEFLILLKENKKLGKKEISDRKKKGIISTRSEFINPHIEIKTKKEKFASTHLKGVSASTGVVRGICKIVYSKSEINKVSDKDIMVAIGTDFDLMEAIHRSAGVITEEGGLLSHASVVCRELKKPCCISVNNATSILFDGLEVELNATTGVITIL